MVRHRRAGVKVRTAGPRAGWSRSPRLIATCPTSESAGPRLPPGRARPCRSVTGAYQTTGGPCRGERHPARPVEDAGGGALGDRNPPATHILATLGYAGSMRFEAGELALLDETEEIEIETAAPGGGSHRTIIWVVV